MMHPSKISATFFNQAKEALTKFYAGTSLKDRELDKKVDRVLHIQFGTECKFHADDNALGSLAEME